MYLAINPLNPSVIVWLHFECTAPYSSNLPFLIFDIRRESARMSKIKNGGLDQYDKM